MATGKSASLWSRLPDLRQRLEKQWSSGQLLRACRQPSDTFPLDIPVKKPERDELMDAFDSVRDWHNHWQRNAECHAFTLVWQEINHRQLGRNCLLKAVRFDEPWQALKLLGKQREGQAYCSLANEVIGTFPDLAEWVEKHPHALLQHGDEWPRLKAVVQWLQANPRPDIYLRQLDIPGVDTKFIERRKQLLSQWLDYLLPEQVIDKNHSGGKGFERRYGFAGKPALIRFRILDSDCAIAGLTDMQIPVTDFAGLRLSVAQVFIVENDITALAFPPCPRSLVIFGQGYGIDQFLSRADWLKSLPVFYWGDIDTHGLHILDRVRAVFPHCQSLLMDRATLLDHKALWGQEPSPVHHPLPNLRPDEQALYHDLVNNRYGRNLRLEQERIRLSKLQQLLSPTHD